MRLLWVLRDFERIFLRDLCFRCIFLFPPVATNCFKSLLFEVVTPNCWSSVKNSMNDLTTDIIIDSFTTNSEKSQMALKAKMINKWHQKWNTTMNK